MVDRERNHWKLTSFAPPFLCRVRFGRGSFFELILLRLLSLLRRCCWSAVLALCLVPLWSHSAATPLRDGQAEQRLMQVLALTSAGLTQQALPLAEELVVTEIDADIDGDAFAPVLGPEWRATARQPLVGADGTAMAFVTYRRTPAAA